MEIEKSFDAKKIQSKWYEHWTKNGYFSSIPNEKTPFTIVIPPPNVTGILHMGHMLNNTIQDVLIRKARLEGFNACWVPGTDHASIATEAKVVKHLKEQGIQKEDLSRDKFLSHAWDWTEKYGGKILDQLKRLGCSCDWSRTKFTLDSDMSESVIKVFIDLHEKGLIYRGYKMVNWDPEAKTTLSNEEVVFVEEETKIFFISYKISESDDEIHVATTRPETIFGDTAIAVNPKDTRYQKFIGQNASIPILNKSIPIISDDLVDPEFGTGCLKITPAHSENDKEIGDRHNLELVDILNDDGSLNHFNLHYSGMDRFEARKKIVVELNSMGALIKSEPYVTKIGRSERTNCIIEPRLSKQWFLKMEKIAKPALNAVLNNEVKFFPKKFKNIYRNWMENIRDWNISRQLWWGHRIPVYYYTNDKNNYVVAENIDEALKLINQKKGFEYVGKEKIFQENDVLDTWFSSWIWPISVFDGIRNPDNKDFKYYYPTNDLVTGPDILFFWVARMIVSGYEFKKNKPFNSVYFTGLVRDKLGRKMSKQLGNSPDALKLIDKFGADSVRVGLLFSAPAGNDLLFDESLCQQGKNFSNKIWNSLRLLKSWTVSEKLSEPKTSTIASKWFESKFNSKLNDVEDFFRKYRISDALITIYKLIWEDYCSWYLEIIKPNYGESIDQVTYKKTLKYFKKCLKILHPFMPFLTEEIWSLIKDQKESSIIISNWPNIGSIDSNYIENFQHTQKIITNIRKFRNVNGISVNKRIELLSKNKPDYNFEFKEIVLRLVNVSIEFNNEKINNNLSSIMVESKEYFISNNFELKDDLSNIRQQLDYNLGFLKSIQSKLNNKKFVDNAPKQVLLNEQKKERDTLEKIKILESKLSK